MYTAFFIIKTALWVENLLQMKHHSTASYSKEVHAYIHHYTEICPLSTNYEMPDRWQSWQRHLLYWEHPTPAQPQQDASLSLLLVVTNWGACT